MISARLYPAGIFSIVNRSLAPLLTEIFAPLGCLSNEFYCNGTCIDSIHRCDRKVHCPNGEDEEDCGKQSNSTSTKDISV